MEKYFKLIFFIILFITIINIPLYSNKLPLKSCSEWNSCLFNEDFCWAIRWSQTQCTITCENGTIIYCGNNY